jgi:small neutral amino acid transporter SnatA (MarC family)
MSEVLLMAAFVAAVNPLRSRIGLPEAAGGRVRPAAFAIGAVVSVGVIALLGWWSAPILETLEVTPETFRIAAGLVAILAGGWAFAVPTPTAEPEFGGWRDGLWPIAFPRILAPEVLMLVLAGATQNGVAASTGAAATAVAVLGLLGAVPGTGRSVRVLAAAGRVLAVLLVVVGVFLMIDGIRDV